MEFVTTKEWDGFARRLERSCLKTHGVSLTTGSISRAANWLITEIRGNGMFVKGDWRQAMRDVAETYISEYLREEHEDPGERIPGWEG